MITGNHPDFHFIADFESKLAHFDFFFPFRARAVMYASSAKQPSEKARLTPPLIQSCRWTRHQWALIAHMTAAVR
jgi:hypothetical protein